MCVEKHGKAWVLYETTKLFECELRNLISTAWHSPSVNVQCKFITRWERTWFKVASHDINYRDDKVRTQHYLGGRKNAYGFYFAGGGKLGLGHVVNLRVPTLCMKTGIHTGQGLGKPMLFFFPFFKKLPWKNLLVAHDILILKSTIIPLLTQLISSSYFYLVSQGKCQKQGLQYTALDIKHVD